MASWTVTGLAERMTRQCNGHTTQYALGVVVLMQGPSSLAKRTFMVTQHFMKGVLSVLSIHSEIFHKFARVTFVMSQNHV
ncbi:MAG: hypothetical protein CMF24_08705 [Ilumatobacter sp.]|nr:hypothetical protein [Ilumatobacter sp.]